MGEGRGGEEWEKGRTMNTTGTHFWSRGSVVGTEGGVCGVRVGVGGVREWVENARVASTTTTNTTATRFIVVGPAAAAEQNQDEMSADSATSIVTPTSHCCTARLRQLLPPPPAHLHSIPPSPILPHHHSLYNHCPPSPPLHVAPLQKEQPFSPPPRLLTSLLSPLPLPLPLSTLGYTHLSISPHTAW